MFLKLLPIALLFGLLCSASKAVLADAVDDDLAIIAKVGPMGTGSQEARAARDRLARRGSEILPQLLDAMDTPNAVAANWCRTIMEPIAARELEKPQPDLPVAFLKEFASSPKRQGKTRRLVLRLLDRLEPKYRSKLLPELLDDPEFRGDAVALTLEAGDRAKAAGQKEEARRQYRRAFVAAREAGQVTTAAAKLREAGEEADVIRALGLVIDWHFVGPFPAPGYTGFAKVFPPEEADPVDLSAAYPRESGEPARWKRYQTPDALGSINLTQAIAPAAEAVGYACTELDVAEGRQAEVRCGADDNITVWLNGEKVLAREQWLNGTRFDRFVAPVTLLAGRNRLLVKVCQGPQHKNPDVPNNWTMQLRLCDESGAGIDFRSALSAVETK